MDIMEGNVDSGDEQFRTKNSNRRNSKRRNLSLIFVSWSKKNGRDSTLRLRDHVIKT